MAEDTRPSEQDEKATRALLEELEAVARSLREHDTVGDEEDLPLELQFTPEELAQGRRNAQRQAYAVLLKNTRVPREGYRLGDWFRAVRSEHGLTAAEVGDLVGLSGSEWLAIEESREPLMTLPERTLATILEVFSLPRPIAARMMSSEPGHAWTEAAIPGDENDRTAITDSRALARLASFARAVWKRGREAIKQSSQRAHWARRVVLVSMVAMACLLAVGTLQRDDGWQARGNGAAVLAAVLRVFCAPSGQSMRELHPGQACPPGAQLMFAVGAKPPLSQVTVQILGMGNSAPEGPIRITGEPGKEQHLRTMIPLPDAPGTVEVLATFSAARSLQSGIAQGHESQEVVRRQLIPVEATP